MAAGMLPSVKDGVPVVRVLFGAGRRSPSVRAVSTQSSAMVSSKVATSDAVGASQQSPQMSGRVPM